MRLKYVEGHHGYYLDGKRCKGVSTVAKIPDDSFALDQWRKRMVAAGVALAADELVAPIKVAFKAEDRNALDELAEKALDAAGAFDKSRAGTAAHTLTELADKGVAVEDPDFVVARWNDLLSSAGLTVELIERMVLHPEHRIAGRYDRIARRQHDGKACVLDLKTGASAVKYPHAVAVQLALYARAPLFTPEPEHMEHVSEPDEDGNRTYVTESFFDQPDDLDQKVGYMLHVPDDGQHKVYAVNLDLGWQVFQEVILPTLKWRATDLDKIVRAL